MRYLKGLVLVVVIAFCLRAAWISRVQLYYVATWPTPREYDPGDEYYADGELRAQRRTDQKRQEAFANWPNIFTGR